MQTGKPVARQWVLMLVDGSAVVDWGDQRYQDLATGSFMGVDEARISHPARDADLDLLRLTGMIAGYDSQNVYLTTLPEAPRHELG